MWFVYILRCRDRSFYTGITTDPARRLQEHNAGKGGAYTRSCRPVRMVFQEKHPSRSSALKREAEIKRLKHTEKIRMKTTGTIDIYNAVALKLYGHGV